MGRRSHWPVGAQMFVAICGFSTLTYTFQQMLHSIALIAVGCWMIKSTTDQMMLYLQHTVQDWNTPSSITCTCLICPVSSFYFCARKHLSNKRPEHERTTILHHKRVMKELLTFVEVLTCYDWMSAAWWTSTCDTAKTRLTSTFVFLGCLKNSASRENLKLCLFFNCVQ